MSWPESSRRLSLSAIVTLLVVPLGLLGCAQERGATASAPNGSPAERAFLSAMVEHHAAATQMARLAQARADAPLISRLAGSIIDARQEQVQEMSQFRAARYGGPASTAEAGARAPATTQGTTGPET